MTDRRAAPTRHSSCAGQPSAAGSVGATSMLVILITAAGCGAPSSPQVAVVEPVYDVVNGRLVRLRYDADRDGRAETVSYMDGGRLLRAEIDTDRDGTVDRWEYYDAQERLERVGASRARDGKEDAWSFVGPDKMVTRIELSTARDGRVDRTERYDRSGLVTAEEDTDRDGRVDKWETYERGRLAAIAFDTGRRGIPDHRLVYDAAGGARVETHLDGSSTPVTAGRRTGP